MQTKKQRFRGVYRCGGTLALAAGLLMIHALPAAAQTRIELEGEAELLLPGKVSTEHAEVQATVHPLGASIVWGCEDCSRVRGAELMRVSKRGPDWSGGARLSISLKDNETQPTFSSDGGWLYFLSDRPGAFGGSGVDLYRSRYVDYKGSFSPSENLGPGINSEGEEGGITASEQGGSVVFASNGRKGARGWDLFFSKRYAGRMTDGKGLRGINTRADEFDPTWLSNDAGLVFARSEKKDASPSALWFAPRKGDGYGEPVLLGEAVNASGTSVRAPVQDLSQPGRLLFTRTAAQPDAKPDIYTIRYRIVQD